MLLYVLSTWLPKISHTTTRLGVLSIMDLFYLFSFFILPIAVVCVSVCQEAVELVCVGS